MHNHGLTESEDTEIKEKHLVAVITEMGDEEKQLKQTSEENEITQNEISHGEITEEKEAAKTHHPVSLCKETTTVSLQEHELKAEECVEEETNTIYINSANAIQNEELSVSNASKNIEEQVATEDRSVQDPEQFSVVNEIIKESFPNEFEAKDTEDAAIKLAPINQGEETNFGSGKTETTTPRDEKIAMAGLEELKKKLAPLFDAEKGFSAGSTFDPSDSCMLSDGGTVNLLSRSYGMYNINELGLQKCTSASGSASGFGPMDEADRGEKTYRCASHEMRIFGSIGSGASSVVQRAIHIPTHKIIALKKINIFEKEKRQQLLTEIRTLCEAPCYEGLVEFHGAFYTPDSGQISIALEYMDGGSLADILRLRKNIPEPVLSSMFQKILQGLRYLHGVRHLVHRDIKPANLLVNLKGEPKITDFGISAGLENSMAMCATFVGTVTYMSPERIRNESYSCPADIWSLGLALFECGTGEFPYTANEGPVNLMLQILEDPSPSPSKHKFSSEFCSFIDACLQKDADARPTAEQLLSHPFITMYEHARVDLATFVRSVFDPTKRMKDLADMLTMHYYLLFDGSDELWQHSKTLYKEGSTFRFSGKQSIGPNDIFVTLSNIRSTLAGDWPPERLVHVVEKLQCRAHGQDGVAIRVSGSFIIGNQFLICGDGVQVEGLPNFKDLSIDISSKRMGTFQEQFIMEPSNVIGHYTIAKQELYITQ